MKGFVRHRLAAAIGPLSQSCGCSSTWARCDVVVRGVVVRRLCRQGLYRPSRQSDRPDQGLIPPLACPWCMAPDGASVDRCAGGMDPRSAWPVHARGAWIARRPARSCAGGRDRTRRAAAPHLASVEAGQPDDVSLTRGTTAGHACSPRGCSYEGRPSRVEGRPYLRRLGATWWEEGYPISIVPGACSTPSSFSKNVPLMETGSPASPSNGPTASMTEPVMA